MSIAQKQAPSKPKPKVETKTSTAPSPTSQEASKTPVTSSSSNTTVSNTKTETNKTDQLSGQSGQNPLKFNSVDQKDGENVDKPKLPIDPSQPKVPTNTQPPIIPTENPPGTGSGSNPPLKCVTIKCCRMNFTHFNVLNYVTTKIGSPKNLYYSLQANSWNQIEYQLNLTSKIQEYKFIIDNMRLMIKELIMKEKISPLLFRNTDLILHNKRISLEKRIQQNSLTVKYLNDRITKMLVLQNKLKISNSQSSACLEFNGKKVCELIEKGDLFRKKKYYFNQNLFTLTYYYREKAKILNFKRNKNVISFIRHSDIWVKETRTINKKIRDLIFNRAIESVSSKSIVKAIIEDEIKREKRKKNPLQNTYVIQRVVQQQFNHMFNGEVERLIQLSEFKKMRSEYQDTFISKEKEDSVTTEEMISVPSSISKLSDIQLIKLFTSHVKIN